MASTKISFALIALAFGFTMLVSLKGQRFATAFVMRRGEKKQASF
jgi:hypothetical protein